MYKHKDDLSDDSDKKIYICPVCQKQFSLKKELTKHINSTKNYEHEQYVQRVKELKKTYKAVDSLKELKCLKCKESNNNCHDCSLRTKCDKVEKTIYNQVLKRLLSVAGSLVDKFYEQCNSYCLNRRVEVAKVKNQLRNYEYEQVKASLQLLISRGDKDLQFFGPCIVNEAVKYLEIKHELTEKDSLLYLIKQYYNKLNLIVSSYLLLQNYKLVEKVKEAHKLNSEQIIFAIKYIMNNKIVPFNKLENLIVKILMEYNEKKATTNYLQSAVNNLKNGTITYEEIISIYGEKDLFNQQVIDTIKDKQYNNNFSAIEWLYKIQFPLTEDIYFMAKENVKINNEKLYHFCNDSEINKFKDWLREYKFKYE